MIMNPEKTEDIIPRTKTAKSVVGKEIKCKFCKCEARIILEDFRFMIRCPVCLSEYLLKEQHI